MKYPYYLEYVFDEPVMRFSKEMELVTLFLFCDVDCTIEKNFFLVEIERVLRGEIPVSEVAGNVHALTIKKDFTTIVDRLAKFTGTPGVPYVIETEELRSLVLIWLGLKQRKPTKYLYRVEFLNPESPIMYISEKMRLVTLFFSIEVQGSRDSAFFLGEIKRVFRGEAPIAKASGDSYALEIRPDFTTVIDTQAEDPNDPHSRCVIETEELGNLLLSWSDLKWCISEERRTRVAAVLERHTDPQISVPVLPIDKALSPQEHLSAEQKEQASEVLC